MKKKSRISVFLTMTLAAFTSTSVLAQDVVVDFAKEGKADGKLQTLLKEGNVSFKFVGSNSEPYGAYIYGIDNWASVYYLTIESPSDIAVIEYQVVTSGTKPDELSVTTGTITKNADNTRVWKGTAKKLTFTGALSNTSCSISRLRLWYNESEYTPGTSWETEENKDNPYAADINLAEDKTDYTQVNRTYAPVNILPRNGRGVPMAVVSAPQFKTTLDSYLKWKTKQGYEVTEIYTNDIPGQKSGEELAYAIREKLKNLNPRPAYVLLVGDVNELPSFIKVSAADLYYGEYTDDYFTDAYVGRFSATTTTELEAQMNKTRYMAYLTPENGEWLKHSLTIDDITPEISVMNPASALSLNYPLNFKDNTSYKTST
ncbi:MAG: hypothetical protein KBT12_00805 [Bacteroidales bacterium]|nr:hypothetical protein [Candidatus Physcousia equi]